MTTTNATPALTRAPFRGGIACPWPGGTPFLPPSCPRRNSLRPADRRPPTRSALPPPQLRRPRHDSPPSRIVIVGRPMRHDGPSSGRPVLTRSDASPLGRSRGSSRRRSGSRTARSARGRPGPPRARNDGGWPSPRSAGAGGVPSMGLPPGLKLLSLRRRSGRFAAEPRQASDAGMPDRRPWRWPGGSWPRRSGLEGPAAAVPRFLRLVRHVGRPEFVFRPARDLAARPPPGGENRQPVMSSLQEGPDDLDGPRSEEDDPVLARGAPPCGGRADRSSTSGRTCRCRWPGPRRPPAAASREPLERHHGRHRRVQVLQRPVDHVVRAPGRPVPAPGPRIAPSAARRRPGGHGRRPAGTSSFSVAHRNACLIRFVRRLHSRRESPWRTNSARHAFRASGPKSRDGRRP